MNENVIRSIARIAVEVSTIGQFNPGDTNVMLPYGVGKKWVKVLDYKERKTIFSAILSYEYERCIFAETSCQGVYRSINKTPRGMYACFVLTVP